MNSEAMNSEAPSGNRLVAVRRSLLAWAATRVAVLTSLFLANIVTDEPEPLPLRQGLLSWDAWWYRVIAESGYADAPEDAERYFPLLPLAGRWIGEIFGGRVDIGLVVVVWVLSLAASIALHELVLREAGDRAASASVWALALFPTAFVLVAPYTEAALLLFGSCFVFGFREKRWTLAIVAGILAGLSRPVGGLLMVYAAAEMVWPTPIGGDSKQPQRRLGIGSILALVSPAIGIATYALWANSAGFGLRAPFDAQRGLRGPTRDPVTRLAEAFWNGVTGDTTELLHGVTAVACFVLAGYLWRRGSRALAVYAVVGVVMSLSSTNINSLLRYAHGLIPVLVALAMLASNERISRRAHVVLASIAGCAVVGFTVAMLTQNYVP